MKPRGGLSLSTRWGDFYGYKLNLVALSQFTGFWRKGRAFQQSLFALAETLQKRMHPLESGDTSFSVYSDGRSPLGAYASSLLFYHYLMEGCGALGGTHCYHITARG